MDVNKFQGIIFDKDGTLFEFRATWEAWAQAFLLRLTQNDRELASLIGEKIGFDFENRRFLPDSVVIAGTPGEISHAINAHFPAYSYDQLLSILNEEAALAPQVEAVPLMAFLRELKDIGLKIGVATNDAQAPAMAHLESAGVAQLFDFIAGFDSGFGAKPEPGQLLAFCARTGCDAQKVIMVGDSIHDLKAGRAAGMTCVGVLTGLASRETLAPYADAVFADIGHIPAWIQA